MTDPIVCVCWERGYTAATTLAGQSRYEPVPSGRHVVVGVAGVAAPVPEKEIEELRRRLREEG